MTYFVWSGNKQTTTPELAKLAEYAENCRRLETRQGSSLLSDVRAGRKAFLRFVSHLLVCRTYAKEEKTQRWSDTVVSTTKMYRLVCSFVTWNNIPEGHKLCPTQIKHHRMAACLWKGSSNDKSDILKVISCVATEYTRWFVTAPFPVKCLFDH